MNELLSKFNLLHSKGKGASQPEGDSPSDQPHMASAVSRVLYDLPPQVYGSSHHTTWATKYAPATTGASHSTPGRAVQRGGRRRGSRRPAIGRVIGIDTLLYRHSYLLE